MQTRIFAMSWGLAVALTGTTAFSQDSSAPGAAPIGLAEVIVTARRREESQQTVPVSVSALDTAALEQTKIGGMLDLQRQVPSLSMTMGSPSRDQMVFSLRGQRSNEFQLLTDQPVGTYFAEVVQPRPTGFGAVLYDLQNVQVLKGVQGTLFGRNVTGGAVLVEPQHPTNEFDVQATLTAGNYQRREAMGVVNVPIADSVALRIAGKAVDRNGYFTDLTTGRDFDDDNARTARVSLLLKPIETIESLFIFDTLRERKNGTAVIFAHPATPNAGCLPASCRPIDFYSPPINGIFGFPDAQAIAAQQATLTPHRQFRTGPQDQFDAVGSLPYSNVDNQGIINKTQIQLGDYTLKNIAGYRHMLWRALTDMDGSVLPFIYASQHQDIRNISEELQLQGNSFGDSLSWIVGGYYFREYGEDSAPPTSQFPDLAKLAFLPAAVTTKDILLYQLGRGDAQSLAGFAAGTFKFTDQWKLSGGIRYTTDRRVAISQEIRPYINHCEWTPATPVDQCRFSNEKRWNAVTWDGTLQYQYDPDLMTYVSVRRGFRAGGFSLRPTSQAEFQPFDPEYVTEYELGLKSDWRFGPSALRTNVALYYQDYTDVQRQFRQNVAGTVVTKVLNTPKQEIYGGELEATLVAFDGLEFNLSYALIKSHVLDSGPVFVRYALVGSAENTVKLNGTYRLPLPSDIGPVSIGASWYWQGESHLVDTDVEGNEPAYDLLNLKLSWDNIFNSGVGVAAFVNNVSDKMYRVGVISLQSAGVGYTGDMYGDPRTYGIELNYKFRH